MKILVTGGAGFIGSNIVDAYIDSGHEVAVLDNLSSGKEKNLNKKAKFYKADLRDENVRFILREFKPEIINHLAAQIDVRKSVTDPIFNAQVNDLGTLNLLEAAVKSQTKKIIFPSTGGTIYGETPEKNGAAETHPLYPICPYAITKHSAEMYLYFYQVTYGLNFTVLRYGNVYGPRQDPHGEAGVIAIFIGKMLQGLAPTIFGNGKQQRDYIYIADICRANQLALKSGNQQIYNVGTGQGISVNQLFAALHKILGSDLKAKYAPARTGELFRTVLNCRKIKKELGWKAEIDIVSGLRKTVEYFKHA